MGRRRPCSDRAKERREDANPDYVGAEEATANLQSLHSVAPPGHPNALDPLREAELHRQIIENSKFLGGDVEHTHLVKGLDFALLQKVRPSIPVLPCCAARSRSVNLSWPASPYDGKYKRGSSANS